jgi:hypothetical protein
MDPVTIALIIGLATLIVERSVSLLSRWKKLRSSCCGNDISIDMEDKIDPKEKI